MKLDQLNGLLVTGTDTGIGKTWVSALIIEELRKKGVSAVGLKPVLSGTREDAEKLWEANGGTLALDLVNPWWYRTPVAPVVASRIEGNPLDLDAMVKHIHEIRDAHDFTLVEGVGGWEVPMGEDFAFPEFAKALGFPILVVAANWLGTLNHTLLTVKAIQAAGLECAGVVLNHLEAERDVAATTNRMMLDELCPVPIVGEVLTDADWIDWTDT
ncbi:MAG: dethiobiotin synthetase [Akkermansiaceae bacterium]|jgi:dethiobiotin synthetase